MSREALAEAAARAARGEPFVLATVVWRRGPSSGRAGSWALIDPAGKVTGWLGGACAEPTVVREALAALADGGSRLLYLGPADDKDGRGRDGVVSVPMACESEGAMEVYLEPVLPGPRLAIVGRSPAVDTLARMAAELGWRPVVVDDGGDAADHPGVAQVVTTLDLASLGLDGGSFVVVATQGHYDEPALEAALATAAGYVGLVASRKRADAVVEYLRGRGISEEALARIDAPAGLDLGSLDQREMAVAILAQLVQLRAAGGVPAGVEVTAPSVAVDPVCEMTVDIASARWTADHDGTTYYFCAPGCRKAFETNPSQFL